MPNAPTKDWVGGSGILQSCPRNQGGHPEDEQYFRKIRNHTYAVEDSAKLNELLEKYAEVCVNGDAAP